MADVGAWPARRGRVSRRALLGGAAALLVVPPRLAIGAQSLVNRSFVPRSELVLYPRAPTNPVTGSGDPICIVEPQSGGLLVTWVRRTRSGYEVVRAEQLRTTRLTVRRQADVVSRSGTVSWVQVAASPTAEPLGWGI